MSKSLKPMQSEELQRNYSCDAQPLLHNPAVLDKVVETLHSAGVAGQEKEIRLLYLILTTRVLDHPVSAAVKGPSAGGKSHLVERVLSLFPPSAYYALSAMSSKALAFSEEPLIHRFLVIFEAAGMGSEISQYLIRSLLSEGRVRYEYTAKNEGGYNTRLVEREGPTGLIVTTTLPGLHPENETRLLTIEVDDTPEQTKAVLLEQARENSHRNVDLEPFVEFQRLIELERPQVIIPFAEELAHLCNPSAVRLRRDFPKVLNLVKAHAILHSHSRDKNPEGQVVATMEDYSAVYDLVSDIAAEGIESAVRETMRETVRAVATLLQRKPQGLSIQEIASYLHLDKATVSRRVRSATAKGYLVNLEQKKFALNKIILGDPLLDDLPALPHPDQLLAKH